MSNAVNVEVPFTRQEYQALLILVDGENKRRSTTGSSVEVDGPMFLRGILRSIARQRGVNVEELPGVSPRKRIARNTALDREENEPDLDAAVKKLREVCKKLVHRYGYTQNEIARLVGKDQAILSTALRGSRGLDSTLNLLADVEKILARLESASENAAAAAGALDHGAPLEDEGECAANSGPDDEEPPPSSRTAPRTDDEDALPLPPVRSAPLGALPLERNHIPCATSPPLSP